MTRVLTNYTATQRLLLEALLADGRVQVTKPELRVAAVELGSVGLVDVAGGYCSLTPRGRAVALGEQRVGSAATFRRAERT